MRREERLLRRVLGFGTVAQQCTAETRDGALVRGEELLGPCGGRPVPGAAVRFERFVRRASQSPPPPPLLSPLSSSPWLSPPWLLSDPPRERLTVTVWPMSEAGSVRPAGSGTVSVWPWTFSVTEPGATAAIVAWTASVLLETCPTSVSS